MNTPSWPNVGTFDAAARFAAGCVLLIFANHGHSWGLTGFVVAASAAGFCPIYWLLGINTTACDRSPAAPIDRPKTDQPLRRKFFVETPEPWRSSREESTLEARDRRTSR